MKSIIPIGLLVASIALFMTFIDPMYQDVQTLKAEVQNYDDALTKSKELLTIRDTLLDRYNSFSTDDLKRLEFLLPDTVDNIRLVLDIDGVASRHGIVIKDLKLAATSQSDQSLGPVSTDIKTVDLSFTVAAEYDTFLTFIRDLQDSLRIVDITQINFGGVEKGFTNYSITIRTYWLP